MLSIVILCLTVAGAAALVTYYYRTIGGTQKQQSDFNNDGQLHLIYPES